MEFPKYRVGKTDDFQLQISRAFSDSVTSYCPKGSTLPKFAQNAPSKRYPTTRQNFARGPPYDGLHPLSKIAQYGESDLE